MSGNQGSLICSGRMWLNRGQVHYLGPNRVSLLETIAELGSISKAAKSMGMSYKAAWDAIELMNHLSDEPLVVRVSGGKGGGGTQVTEHGLKLIGFFRKTEESFRHYLVVLNERLANEFGAAAPQPQARSHLPNRFEGKVARINRVGETAEVAVTLDAGGEVIAAVPGALLKGHALKSGSPVSLFIKPADVFLLREDEPAGIMSPNILPGAVQQITEGAVEARLLVRLDAGRELTVLHTLGTSRELGIARGDRVVAVFRPADVLLILPLSSS